ncbi:YVTN family beta-propeller repeat protein [Mycolicibacterium rhodesiae NBB3]|uniref:YVTN family beta-propeller repeat protein n=1 Tax=Mycolicibacterium rhodesiae (strain NBB3) TaxID=710685 RepID=G8RV33_MYCRN|nr:beta-propeller fold lactonase family protein [Mycolicibacterium rhodesiae]AEV71714.1 YVTN family beta-propeller repeat protein [Mycolicibacterium rhodesiae NBB3]
MENAKYIGRVGALAVALGIGTAVIALPWVAVADPSSESSADSSADSSTSGSDSPGSESPSAQDGSSDKGSSSDKDSSAAKSTSTDDSTPATSVSASGGANTTVKTSEEAESSEGSNEKSETSDEGIDESSDTKGSADKPVNEDAEEDENIVEVAEFPDEPKPNGGDSDHDGRTAAQPIPAPPAERATAEPLVLAEDADSVEDAPADTGARAENATVATISVFTEDILKTDAVAPATARMTVAEPAEAVAEGSPVSVVPDLVTGLLTWVGWDPSMGDAPALPPMEAPALLGLFELARRQDQRDLLNRAPTTAYNPRENVELDNGVIIGDLHAGDPDGDPLTFTVTQQPRYGSLVVHRDGTFTYTPDAKYPDAELDSFIVDIDDGLAYRRAGPAVSLGVSLHRGPVVALPDDDVVDSHPDVVVTPHVVDTIAVGDAPAGVAVSPDSATVYVTNSGNDTVSVIDAATNTVTATIDVGDTPFGLAVSPDGAAVYVSNSADGTVSVIDTASNTVTATVAVGTNAGQLVVSSDGARVYVANTAEDTVYVIDTESNAVLSTFATGDAPGGMALSADGATLYVANNLAGTVSVIDTVTGGLIDTVDVGDFPTMLLLSPDGSLLYVADDAGFVDTVSVIDTATNTYVDVIEGAPDPLGLAISPNGTYLYVANFGNYAYNTLTVFNTSTEAIVATITVGNGPTFVTISPDGDYLYVLNTGDDTVSVIAL